ncbi:DUF1415 domain-containing protein [Chitinophaga sp. OAE865]|uniref:DUF1415 domain-containing protein n=1 Tax=Chitinophaga sp. OAE865 TaxID=2817898 RepID=UPI0033994C67
MYELLILKNTIPGYCRYLRIYAGTGSNHFQQYPGYRVVIRIFTAMVYNPEQAATVISQTRNWVREIVIGCNFCPFANREVKKNSIHYQVSGAATLYSAGEELLQECLLLDRDPAVSTTLLIFPGGFAAFHDYLDLVAAAEKMIHRKKYTGIYQLASFHPLYQFAGTEPEDAANYTNRSIYPMLHLLREAEIAKALSQYPHPENIPGRNIDFAREKGSAYMKMLRDSCL